MYRDRVVEDYLADILNAVEETEEFTRGMTYEDFAADRKTVNAVIRSLEVLGEASKGVPGDFRNRHPDIPWSKMCGLRDVLIHNYMGVDLMTVWKVVQERLPELKPRLLQMLQKKS